MRLSPFDLQIDGIAGVRKRFGSALIPLPTRPSGLSTVGSIRSTGPAFGVAPLQACQGHCEGFPARAGMISIPARKAASVARTTPLTRTNPLLAPTEFAIRGWSITYLTKELGGFGRVPINRHEVWSGPAR